MEFDKLDQYGYDKLDKMYVSFEHKYKFWG